MTVYVVAGTAREFNRFLAGPGTAYETEIHPLKNHRQIRIMRPGDIIICLVGRREDGLVDWQQREDWRRIYNTMLATGRRGLIK